MTPHEELENHPGWKWCTYEGSREYDRMVDRRMTFREKIECLEEMETFTLMLRNARRRTGVVDTPPAES